MIRQYTGKNCKDEKICTGAGITREDITVTHWVDFVMDKRSVWTESQLQTASDQLIPR